MHDRLQELLWLAEQKKKFSRLNGEVNSLSSSSLISSLSSSISSLSSSAATAPSSASSSSPIRHGDGNKFDGAFGRSYLACGLDDGIVGGGGEAKNSGIGGLVDSIVTKPLTLYSRTIHAGKSVFFHQDRSLSEPASSSSEPVSSLSAPAPSSSEPSSSSTSAESSCSFVFDRKKRIDCDAGWALIGEQSEKGQSGGALPANDSENHLLDGNSDVTRVEGSGSASNGIPFAEYTLSASSKLSSSSSLASDRIVPILGSVKSLSFLSSAFSHIESSPSSSPVSSVSSSLASSPISSPLSSSTSDVSSSSPYSVEESSNPEMQGDQWRPDDGNAGSGGGLVGEIDGHGDVFSAMDKVKMAKGMSAKNSSRPELLQGDHVAGRGTDEAFIDDEYDRYSDQENDAQGFYGGHGCYGNQTYACDKNGSGRFGSGDYGHGDYSHSSRSHGGGEKATRNPLKYRRYNDGPKHHRDHHRHRDRQCVHCDVASQSGGDVGSEDYCDDDSGDDDVKQKRPLLSSPSCASTAASSSIASSSSLFSSPSTGFSRSPSSFSLASSLSSSISSALPASLSLSTSAAPSSPPSASSIFMTDFFKQMNFLNSEIHQIKMSTFWLVKICRHFIITSSSPPHKEKALRQRINGTIRMTSNRIVQVYGQLRRVRKEIDENVNSQECGTAERQICLNNHQMILRKLKSVLMNWQAAEAEYTGQIKKKMFRQLKLIKPDMSEEEISSLLSSSSSSPDSFFCSSVVSALTNHGKKMPQHLPPQHDHGNVNGVGVGQDCDDRPRRRKKSDEDCHHHDHHLHSDRHGPVVKKNGSADEKQKNRSTNGALDIGVGNNRVESGDLSGGGSADDKSMQQNRTEDEWRKQLKEMDSLQRGVESLQRLFTDLSLIVDSQSDSFNQIEIHVKNSKQAVDTAETELMTAKKYNDKARRQMVWMSFVLIVVAFFILFPTLHHLHSF